MNWLSHFFLGRTPLHYRLNLIVGLFFLFPILSLLYFGFRYDFLTDKSLPEAFLCILCFTLLGTGMLRRILDDIRRMSDRTEKSLHEILNGGEEYAVVGTDELGRLAHSLTVLEGRLTRSLADLDRKTADIAVLRELSDLCYVTNDPDEMLYVTLERALLLTHSDIGSVMVLDEVSGERHFVVKASVGSDNHVRVGTRVDFSASIAKYAVINKAPLIVSDIEKDIRFGRANRSQYGARSFICMPMKTTRDIIGVLTLTTRDNQRVYGEEDAAFLIPLVSNASFAYENLCMVNAQEGVAGHIDVMRRVSKILNADMDQGESLQSLLGEIQWLAHYEYALVAVLPRNHPDTLVLLAHAGLVPQHVSKGNVMPLGNGVLARAASQRKTIIIDDVDMLSAEPEIGLLRHPGIRACLIAPLIMGGTVEGMLLMTSDDSGKLYDIQEMIRWISDSISLAIGRSRLSETVVRRDKELESIKQIGRALASSTFDMGKVLEYTMDMIRMIIDAEAGTLFMVDGDELENAVSFAGTRTTVDKARLRMGQGIAGSVAAKGEALIVNDTSQCPHFYPEVDNMTGFVTRTILCVPMISQGRVIGVIEVLNKRSGKFSSDDEDLLQSIASSVSIAIENARLYKETVALAEHERSIRNVFQKFVPRHIVDRIVHGEEGERGAMNEMKTLALLNIDLRRSSGFVRRIGPQKTVALLNYFFTCMGGIVFKHRGIVDKYLGDGFLALFGAPVSDIDYADNAIAAALEMREAMTAVNEYCREQFGLPLAMGISIHAGQVVAGNIGFDKKMDYTVIGDPVNMVFRLQELVKSRENGILISETVRQAAISSLHLTEVEGLAQGIRVYVLEGRTETVIHEESGPLMS